ncbi:hypothetical protein NDK47_24870 [Brevibacillus ruminantium]|uniref:Uncharacterized protein n=1 Tax=Brevibacillus ruminantium TaxID=2950604 RepID=A0ABY4WE11_9BACL|nr:hypothetical protein [Brevibacillus ruminantium]USG65302.1 hypothetical protein NDK47_24870 [Brevibacillus ruminantium]
MRTGDRVMGIQAKFILERIDETWTLIKKRGASGTSSFLFGKCTVPEAEEAQEHTDAMEAQEVLGTQKVLGTQEALAAQEANETQEAKKQDWTLLLRQDAVFDDHRLTTELAEPNWNGWGQMPPKQVALITDGGNGSSYKRQPKGGNRSVGKRVLLYRQKSTKGGFLVWMGEYSKRSEGPVAMSREPQETRSAPAPP